MPPVPIGLTGSSSSDSEEFHSPFVLLYEVLVPYTFSYGLSDVLLLSRSSVTTSFGQHYFWCDIWEDFYVDSKAMKKIIQINFLISLLIDNAKLQYMIFFCHIILLHLSWHVGYCCLTFICLQSINCRWCVEGKNTNKNNKWVCQASPSSLRIGTWFAHKFSVSTLTLVLGTVLIVLAFAPTGAGIAVSSSARSTTTRRLTLASE